MNTTGDNLNSGDLVICPSIRQREMAFCEWNAKASREDIVEAKCKVREALDDEEFEHVTIDGQPAFEQCASRGGEDR